MTDLEVLRARLVDLESRVYGNVSPASVDKAGSDAALTGRVDTLRKQLARELQTRPNVQGFLAKCEIPLN